MRRQGFPSWRVTTYLLGYLGIASYFVNGPPVLVSATNESQRNYAFSLRIALDPIAFSAGGLARSFLPGVYARAMGETPNRSSALQALAAAGCALAGSGRGRAAVHPFISCRASGATASRRPGGLRPTG
jgi:hypothetical protein